MRRGSSLSLIPILYLPLCVSTPPIALYAALGNAINFPPIDPHAWSKATCTWKIHANEWLPISSTVGSRLITYFGDSGFDTLFSAFLLRQCGNVQA